MKRRQVAFFVGIFLVLILSVPLFCIGSIKKYLKKNTIYFFIL
jgi:NADH:ubiquinone oxidoreductase subunit K